MSILKKKVEKEVVKEEPKVIVPGVALCNCGEPVAIELGQNQVCKAHMNHN
jgi:hypothetical protein